MRKQVEASSSEAKGEAFKQTISEVQKEITDYNETKRTIAELLRYKKELSALGANDTAAFAEIKSKALAAINTLFNDSTQNPKTTF